MVTIEEAKMQVSQARENISQARQQTTELRDKNQEMKNRLSTARQQVVSQRGLRSGKDINAVKVRAGQINQIADTEGKLEERDKAISEYESNITQAEQEVLAYERQIERYEDEVEAARLSEGRVTLAEVEANLQMSLSPELRSKIEAELKKENYKYSDKLVSRLNDVLNEKIKQPDIPKIEDIQPLKAEAITQQVNVATIPEKEKGLYGWSASLAESNRIYETKLLRGEKTTLGEDVNNLLVNFGQAPVSAAIGISQLPKLAVSLVTKPISTVSNIKTGIVESSAVFGEQIKINPIGATSRVGGEVLTGVGSGKAVSSVSEAITISATKLSPKYRPVLETADGNVIKDVPTKTGKIDIPISEKIPTASLPEQARMAGTTRNVISGARDFFGTVFKRERVIEKPIPNQELMSVETKAMLEKFDAGKLPQNKIGELNARIIKETGSKGLLERTFFADPNAVLRPSRLGIRKEKPASVIEMLSGDVTLKRPKPQAILLENQNIQRFPKSLKDVEKALESNKPLTVSQQERLLAWQLKREGKFKPIGFLTREAETTLFGATLRRDKAVAVTVIDGKRVPIIRAEIIKASGVTDDVAGISKGNKLTEKNIYDSSYGIEEVTYVSPYKSGVSAYSTISPSPSPSSKPITSYSSSVPTPSKPTSTSGSSSYGSSSYGIDYKPSPSPYINPPSKPSPYISPPSKPSPYITPYKSPPPRYPVPNYPRYPPKTPPPYIQRAKNSIKKNKEEKFSKAYDVFIKKRGKPVKIASNLPIGKARLLGVKRNLKDLSASFKLEERGFTTERDIDFQPNPSLFRSSKREKDWIVQRAEKRLGARTEVSDIQMFKRQSKKRLKWF